MKEIVLLPLGDKSHIETLLERLQRLVGQGREREFALLLPTRQLLHSYRHKLVKNASRALNLKTFDDLVADTLQATGGEPSPLSALAVEELVRQIMATLALDLPALGSYAQSREMVQSLVYALGQLRRANMTPEELEQSCSKDQVVQDLIVIWREYQARIRRDKFADIEEQYVQAAEALPRWPGLRYLKEIHVAWFFDFEPLQLEILAGLGATGASITVWMPYQHPAHTDYIQRTVDKLQELGFQLRQAQGSVGDLVNNIFLHPSQPVSASVQGLAAPRIKQELQLVARKIKQLVGQGTDPNAICLVVPEQNKYLPQLRKLFHLFQIELSLPRVVNLIAVPWVRELLALGQAAVAGWDRDNLLQVIKSRYITDHLPEDYDGEAVEWALHSLYGQFRGKQWLQQLEQQEARLEQVEAGAGWQEGRWRQLMELYHHAQPGIASWLQLGQELAQPKTRQAHCRRFIDLVESNIPSTLGGEQEQIRDQAARTKFTAIIKEYLTCCLLLSQDTIVDLGEFLMDLKRWLDQDLALERTNPGGVQVLSPAQVRGIDCDFLFVLGLNQGAFPRPSRQHWLLDRVGAGLNTQDQTLAQEKIFFHSCLAVPSQGIILSRLLPGVEEAEVSPFWREVEQVVDSLPLQQLGSGEILPPLQPEAIICPTELKEGLVYAAAQDGEVPSEAMSWLLAQPDYWHLAEASWAELRREGPQPPNNMDGVLAHSTAPLTSRYGGALYSVSRLERYVRCPFSFFARYVLNLEAPPQAQEEYSALEQGTLLHWLLEQFYIRGDVPSEPSKVGRRLRDLAQEWLDSQGKEGDLWQLRARDAVRMLLPLLIRDLAWQQQTGLRPVLHEASFGLAGSAVGPVHPQGGRVGFRGKIDRIDVLEQDGETWAVVYDYKTSQEITKGKILDWTSLQIPVYLAAAPQLLKEMGYKNVKVMGGGYYVIKKAKLAGGIWNQRFTSQVGSRLSALEESEFLQLEQGLATAAGQLHRKIIQGNFPPAPQENACRSCEYKNCCRYDKNRFKLKGGAGHGTTEC